MRSGSEIDSCSASFKPDKEMASVAGRAWSEASDLIGLYGTYLDTRPVWHLTTHLIRGYWNPQPDLNMIGKGKKKGENEGISPSSLWDHSD